MGFDLVQERGWERKPGRGFCPEQFGVELERQPLGNGHRILMGSAPAPDAFEFVEVEEELRGFLQKRVPGLSVVFPRKRCGMDLQQAMQAQRGGVGAVLPGDFLVGKDVPAARVQRTVSGVVDRFLRPAQALQILWPVRLRNQSGSAERPGQHCHCPESGFRVSQPGFLAFLPPPAVALHKNLGIKKILDVPGQQGPFLVRRQLRGRQKSADRLRRTPDARTRVIGFAQFGGDPAIGELGCMDGLGDRRPSFGGRFPDGARVFKGAEKGKVVLIEPALEEWGPGNPRKRIGQQHVAQQRESGHNGGPALLPHPAPAERAVNPDQSGAQSLEVDAVFAEDPGERGVPMRHGLEGGRVQGKAFGTRHVLKSCGEVDCHPVVVVGLGNLACHHPNSDPGGELGAAAFLRHPAGHKSRKCQPRFLGCLHHKLKEIMVGCLLGFPDEQVAIAQVFHKGGRTFGEKVEDGPVGSSGECPQISGGDLFRGGCEAPDVVDEDNSGHLGH